MPKIFAKCLKDWKEISGLFELVYDETRQPAVVVDLAKVGDKTIARTLTINPQWIQTVENLPYEFAYSGLIVISKPQEN
jgi:hypothetical protein